MDVRASEPQLTGQQLPELLVRPPGPRSVQLTERLGAVECPAFGVRRERRAEDSGGTPGPIVLSHGLGSNLWDVDGNRYVDFAAGFGSLLLGHAAPEIAQAVSRQAERLVQGLGDVYASDVKLALLEELAALHPGPQPQVLLGQSGGDAITAALKTATLATGRSGFVAFDGAYHGLGHGPLAACGYKPSFRRPFAAQLNPNVRFVPYPGVRRASAEVSLRLLAQELLSGDVAAVIIEPLLGRGGCVVPPAGFLQRVCELAHGRGAVVIADEIWTGLGRSGALVRSGAEGAPVDILCFGKGLGGGLPISACVAAEVVMRAWGNAAEEVIHTSTHAGAPLGCAAARATLRAIRQAGLVERSARLGEHFLGELQRSLGALPAGVVIDVRGAGLMTGVELSSGKLAQAALRQLLGRGFLVLTGGVYGEVLTLTPPLTITAELLDAFAAALGEVLGELTGGRGGP